MSEARARVVIGFLGTSLDRGFGPKRWNRWRPTVGVSLQPDLAVDRYELLHAPGFEKLAGRVAADIGDRSPATQVRLHVTPEHDPWDFEQVFGLIHEFARGYAFDPEREDYLVHITTGSHVVQICLFLLTESRHLPGRLLQSSPERGRGASVAGHVSVIDLDLGRYDGIAQRFAEERAAGTSFLKGGIDTRSETYNALIDRIELVALRSRRPLLLEGPTGAGKSRLARRVYALRRDRSLVRGALVEVNCATLRGDQAMATLFGHGRGAFTGAVQARDGLLLSAHGGLLFLDEVGELGLDEQAMLLHAIEEGRFLPLGADESVHSEFQLICGTHRDLGAEVAAGRFRADLLARIDTWTFRLPALAERTEDIPPNVDFELDRFAREEGTRVTFNREARARFLAWAMSPAASWERNFRDLSGAVVRMATLAPAGRISVAEVDEEVARLRRSWRGPAAEVQSDVGQIRTVLGAGADALDRFDVVQLAEVLRVCRRSRSLSEAGRVLFAQSRERRASRNDSDRLRKYLGRFGLEWSSVQARQA